MLNIQQWNDRFSYLGKLIFCPSVSKWATFNPKEAVFLFALFVLEDCIGVHHFVETIAIVCKYIIQTHAKYEPSSTTQ